MISGFGLSHGRLKSFICLKLNKVIWQTLEQLTQIYKIRGRISLYQGIIFEGKVMDSCND